MNSTPSIRNAQSVDLPGVRRLLSRCNLPSEGIEDQFVDGFVIAEHGGGIVGAAGVERYGTHGLLRSVAVSESHRGRSVGKSLVEESLTRAWQRGITRVYLLTTDAAAYFEEFGFTTVQRERVPIGVTMSPEFASICPTTATVMELPSPRIHQIT